MDEHARAVAKLEELLADAKAGKISLSMARSFERPDRPEWEKLYYVRTREQGHGND
jgi:hypothetical protein